MLPTVLESFQFTLVFKIKLLELLVQDNSQTGRTFSWVYKPGGAEVSRTEQNLLHNR